MLFSDSDRFPIMIGYTPTLVYAHHCCTWLVADVLSLASTTTLVHCFIVRRGSNSTLNVHVSTAVLHSLQQFLDTYLNPQKPRRFSCWQVSLANTSFSHFLLDDDLRAANIDYNSIIFSRNNIVSNCVTNIRFE